MNEEQVKIISGVKKSYTRGLLNLDEVRNKLKCEGIPDDEIEKVITDLCD